jgi:hypothetical protein
VLLPYATQLSGVYARKNSANRRLEIDDLRESRKSVAVYRVKFAYYDILGGCLRGATLRVW